MTGEREKEPGLQAVGLDEAIQELVDAGLAELVIETNSPSRAVPDEEPTLDGEAGELAEARATIRRLNRRCQSAERGLAEKLEEAKRSGGSLGRGLANSAATLYRDRLADAERERDQWREAAETTLACFEAKIARAEAQLGAIQSWRLSADLTPAQDAALMTLASHATSSSVVNSASDNELRSESEALRRHLLDAITLLRDAKHDAQQEEKEIDRFLASLPDWQKWLPTIEEMRGILARSPVVIEGTET